MSYLANCGDCVHRMGSLLDSDLSNYGEQLCGWTGGDGDTVTQTILRAEREYRDCLKSHSDIQFLCETRERQLRDLDMCRSNLLHIAQEILRLRFDEHYTVAETATYTGRPSRAIGKITTESIKTIAGLMSRKGW